MKNILSMAIIATLAFGVIACKKNKAVTSTAEAPKPQPATQITTMAQDSTLPIGTGTVSHKYKSTCRSVIITTDDDGGELVLIPKDELGAFDIDGKKIKFNYQLLRMPLAEGCTTGKMAAITNISE
jgi:hypothetical protein